MKISLGARAKIAGETMRGEEVELVAAHQSHDEMAPYESLLEDAMQGDETLFVREDSVEAQWRIVDPILENETPIFEYAPHTWGSLEADQIIVRDGGWYNSEPSEDSGAPGPQSKHEEA